MFESDFFGSLAENRPLVVTLLAAFLVAGVAGIYVLYRLRRPQLAGEAHLREYPSLPAEAQPSPLDDGDPFSDGSFTERRVAPRRNGRPVLVLLSDERAQVEPVPGHVIDRSVTGLGVTIEEEGELEPGTIISIRPRNSPDIPWTKLIVRSCNRTGTTWRLGCEFVRPPDSISLMKFG
jgi:hypothetical protein